MVASSRVMTPSLSASSRSKSLSGPLNSALVGLPSLILSLWAKRSILPSFFGSACFKSGSKAADDVGAAAGGEGGATGAAATGERGEAPGANAALSPTIRSSAAAIPNRVQTSVCESRDAPCGRRSQAWRSLPNNRA